MSAFCQHLQFGSSQTELPPSHHHECSASTTKDSGGDFPGGPVVENLPCNAEDMGSIPSLGTKIPHAVEQVSPCIATTETARFGTHRPQLESPCTAKKESTWHTKILCATIKTDAAKQIHCFALFCLKRLLWFCSCHINLGCPPFYPHLSPGNSFLTFKLQLMFCVLSETLTNVSHLN